jgi:membrane protease YdiL (CAAX protease family)
MKLITINQIKYAVALLISTVLFRIVLSNLIALEKYQQTWYLGIIYGIVIFISGWIFGKKDRLTLNLYDIGFRFHLTTYVICNLIGQIWVIFNLTAINESTKSINMTAIFWGLGLILHLIIFLSTRKNAIKGIKKSEIFD